MNTQETINYNRIAEAIDYIKANFKDQPNLDEVAEKVHLSPFHFQRLFSEWAGTSPKKFLQYISLQHAKKLTGRRTVVLLISDGLDTGTAETLDSELVWLKRHTRSLLWLNPLLRFDGYAPIATGASVLNRHVNGMLAIHNLSRLEELAQALTKLLKKN